LAAAGEEVFVQAVCTGSVAHLFFFPFIDSLVGWWMCLSNCAEFAVGMVCGGLLVVTAQASCLLLFNKGTSLFDRAR
jgi:hypothetical protein